MYVIEMDNGQYLTGVAWGSPQTTFDKFGAEKFMSEFEADQFARQNNILYGYTVVSAY